MKWRIIGGVGVVAAASIFSLVGPRHGAAAQSPDQIQAGGGIPVWPWMPGGMTWKPGVFSATPYPLKQVKDSSLPQGQRLVLQPGSQGTVLQVGSTTTTVTPPMPATVATGTAPVHTVKIKGKTYQYDRVMSMMTTAYNGSAAMNGPSGAVAAWNGEPLKPGDVAADPSVVPLGTYLYIDGYGPARAVDTGSAVNGDHLDLFFSESAARISGYGIQFHKVYWLTGRPSGFVG